MCRPWTYLYFLVLVGCCFTQMVDINSLKKMAIYDELARQEPDFEHAIEAYGKLKDDIMSRLVVKKRIPPSLSYSSTVYVYLEPLQLISIDEVEQSIHLSHVTDVRWFDPNLTWDPAFYNNVSEIEIYTSSLWTPRLVLPKNIMDSTVRLPDQVTLMSNGVIVSSFSGHIKSLCHLDLTYFPFDDHRCAIIFLGETSFQLLPDTISRHVDVTKHFRDNSEWGLLQHGCTRKHDTISYVECFVFIKRKSSFYVANLIIPMVLTSTMTLIVFWIPAESGEKISFLVSMFVSCSVFLNYIVETLPRSMSSPPHITILLILVVAKVIVSTAATAVVLRRYKHFRLHNPETKDMNGSGGDKQMDKKLPDVMMAREEFPTSLMCVYWSPIHARAPTKYKVFDSAQSEDKQCPRRSNTWSIGKVVSWWYRLTHDDLDKLFFVILLSVSLATYTALLCV